jgi:hypothetical protein
MTTQGIPTRKIGSPTGVHGDFRLGVGTFGYAFLSPANPTFYQLNFNFDTDLGMLSKSTPIVTFSTSGNIKRFIDYGHKIVWYHGLSDPGPPVLGTTLYYQEMSQRFGGLQAAQQFSRYYQIPNMGHCGGGAATDKFDLLTPLVSWVESGTPPGPVNASGELHPGRLSGRFRAGTGGTLPPAVPLSAAGAIHRERDDLGRRAGRSRPGRPRRSRQLSMRLGGALSTRGEFR